MSNDLLVNSLRSSDTSRLTYIISELLASKKSVWNHDYKGTKIKEFVLVPVLNHIRECITKFLGKISTKISKNKEIDIDKINSQMKCGLKVAEIANLIDNNTLVDDILKYISPYFCVDKDNDNNIEQITYFIDKE